MSTVYYIEYNKLNEHFQTYKIPYFWFFKHTYSLYALKISRDIAWSVVTVSSFYWTVKVCLLVDENNTTLYLQQSNNNLCRYMESVKSTKIIEFPSYKDNHCSHLWSTYIMWKLRRAREYLDVTFPDRAGVWLEEIWRSPYITFTKISIVLRVMLGNGLIS